MSIYLSFYLSICKFENEAILWDFLNCSSWQRQKQRNSARLPQVLNWTLAAQQRQKRSNSARLPQFSKLAASKTKQFCETSFNNGKLSAELTASYQYVLQFFQSMCLKYCACRPGHTKCCACHTKSPSQNWRSDPPKCNPSQEISALTS